MAVVLVTGVHDVDWALRGLQHGVVDYLLKPFDQRSLSRALENGVRQHRLRRADRLLREQRASELGVRHARLVQAMTRLDVSSTAQVEAALDLVAFRNDVWREHSHARQATGRGAGDDVPRAGQPGRSPRAGRAAARTRPAGAAGWTPEQDRGTDVRGARLVATRAGPRGVHPRRRAGAAARRRDHPLAIRGVRRWRVPASTGRRRDPDDQPRAGGRRLLRRHAIGAAVPRCADPRAGRSRTRARQRHAVRPGCRAHVHAPAGLGLATRQPFHGGRSAGRITISPCRRLPSRCASRP